MSQEVQQRFLPAGTASSAGGREWELDSRVERATCLLTHASEFPEPANGFSKCPGTFAFTSGDSRGCRRRGVHAPHAQSRLQHLQPARPQLALPVWPGPQACTPAPHGSAPLQRAMHSPNSAGGACYTAGPLGSAQRTSARIRKSRTWSIEERASSGSAWKRLGGPLDGRRCGPHQPWGARSRGCCRAARPPAAPGLWGVVALGARPPEPPGLARPAAHSWRMVKPLLPQTPALSRAGGRRPEMGLPAASTAAAAAAAAAAPQWCPAFLAARAAFPCSNGSGGSTAQQCLIVLRLASRGLRRGCRSTDPPRPPLPTPAPGLLRSCAAGSRSPTERPPASPSTARAPGAARRPALAFR